MQVGHYYPAGKKEAVLEQAFTFIKKQESVEKYPYVPGGTSGITIGVGYDIGKTSEEEFRADWAELKDLRTPSTYSLGVDLNLRDKRWAEATSTLGVASPTGPSQSPLPQLMPPKSKLFSPLDRLAFATKGKLSHQRAIQYLTELRDIAIPEDLSLRVFKTSSLPKWYERTAKAFAGYTDLPAGAQVALLSMVFNRGPDGGKPKDAKKAGGVDDDIFDTRWEVRELRTAILSKDLVWIYWYFESMRRVWAGSNDKDMAGLVKRRNDELTLIFPYVVHDLKFEAFLQRSPRWK